MKTINFFGGPGVGKSTLASGLFYKMKTAGISTELVTEYAKDVTWEGRNGLLTDQIYLLAKQNRRLSRLLDHPVEYAITDSPLLLCAAYTRLNQAHLGSSYSHLIPLIIEVFEGYDNINLLIKRDPSFYVGIGRSQTLDQAQSIDDVVIELLDEYKVPYTTVTIGPTDTIDDIFNMII